MPSVLLQLTSPSLRPLTIALCVLQSLLQTVSFLDQLSHEIFPFLALADQVGYFCLKFLNFLIAYTHGLLFYSFDFCEKLALSSCNELFGFGNELVSLFYSGVFLLCFVLHFGDILSNPIDELSLFSTFLFSLRKILLQILAGILKMLDLDPELAYEYLVPFTVLAN